MAINRFSAMLKYKHMLNKNIACEFDLLFVRGPSSKKCQEDELQNLKQNKTMKQHSQWFKYVREG